MKLKHTILSSCAHQTTNYSIKTESANIPSNQFVKLWLKLFISYVFYILINEVYFLNSHQNYGVQSLYSSTGKINKDLICGHKPIIDVVYFLNNKIIFLSEKKVVSVFHAWNHYPLLRGKRTKIKKKNLPNTKDRKMVSSNRIFFLRGKGTSSANFI